MAKGTGVRRFKLYYHWSMKTSLAGKQEGDRLKMKTGDTLKRVLKDSLRNLDATLNMWEVTEGTEQRTDGM